MNNYDEMKKFLNISRSGAIKKVIREDQGQYYDQQKETKRDLTPDEIEGEKQEFAANVSKLVEFNDFKLGYDNASWSGVFPKEKIEWIYSLDADQGVYISCEMSQLTDGTLELIQKLRGYYETWSEKWAGEIGTKGSETGQPATEPTPGL